VETEALLRKKLEAEANSEATNFIQSWKRKQKNILLLPHPSLW